MSEPSSVLLAAVERNRRRIWALCYRMTGSRAEADDLAQEALARAIERAQQLSGADAEPWLFRVATTTCLDHLRHRAIERRATALVDPVELPEPPPSAGDARDPEAAAILREDVRFAVVVALQRLSPRQRMVIVLRDVCARSTDEVALALGMAPGAVKALLHRARAALERARPSRAVDVPVDRTVVERLAAAIEAGSIDAIERLLADDAWGVADGGAATRPTHGRRAVARQWANAGRRIGRPVTARIALLNGEPALILTVAGLPIATVHLETHAGAITTLRVVRDPRKLAALG